MRRKALFPLMASVLVLMVGHGARASNFVTVAPYEDHFRETRACSDLLDLGLGPASADAAGNKIDGSVTSQAKAEEVLPVGHMVWHPLNCGVGAAQARSQGGVIQRYELTKIATGDHVIHVEAVVRVDSAASEAQLTGLPVPMVTTAYAQTAAIMTAVFFPDTDREPSVGGEFQYVTRWNEPTPTLGDVKLRASLHTTFERGTLVVYAGLASEAVVAGAGTAQTEAAGKVTQITVTAIDAPPSV